MKPDYYGWHPAGRCENFYGRWPAWLALAFKYLYRAGRKPGAGYIDDLRKAVQCIAFEVDELRADPCLSYAELRRPAWDINTVAEGFDAARERAIRLMYSAVWGGELVDSVGYLAAAAAVLNEYIHKQERTT